MKVTKRNEDLWDKISRVNVTKKPPLTQALSDKMNEIRKRDDIKLNVVSKQSGVNSTHMTRNIIYHNLTKINHDVIKLCNYFEININDYLELEEVK